jgi:hydrogenase expression/formation protein HypC
MCLAIPAQLVELRDADTGVVELSGVRKEVSLALVDGVDVGDYVIVHVGYALQKLDPEEAEKTLRLFAQMAVESAESRAESDTASADWTANGSALDSRLTTLD